MLRQGSNPELTLATVFGVGAGEEFDGGIGHGHNLPGIEVAAQTKHRARVDDQLLRGGALAHHGAVLDHQGHRLLLPGQRTVQCVEHFAQMWRNKVVTSTFDVGINIIVCEADLYILMLSMCQ